MINKIAKALYNSKKIDSSYHKAGSTVDGLKVRDDIPNKSSISSTFFDYEILKDVREFPMSELGGPKSVFYATDDFKRSKELAKEIEQSNEINPLIIAIDDKGPYILEGAHRFVALHYLNKTSFPALIVLDEDNADRQASKIASELKIEAWDEYSDDYDPWEVAESADSVAKKSGVRILRDKELSYVVFNKENEVIGAAWTSLENNDNSGFNFSFDVAILSEYRGTIGLKLISSLMDDFDYISSEHPNSEIELDVINSKLVSLMKRKYGLVVEEEHSGHTIMRKRNASLTLDQTRFTQEDIRKIKEYIGTYNIKTISKKEEPQKYEKYLNLFEGHPNEETTMRSPSFVTGIKAYKEIGEKVMLIWRDSSIDDWFLVFPEGFLILLDKENSRINYIASSLVEFKTKMKERIKERRNKFDDFYKKNNLTPDQEPKDIAIMIPGFYENKYSIISPSNKSKGKWQLTYFDEKGPFGDQTHNSLDEAIKETYIKNLNKAEVIKGQQSRLQIASIALFYMRKIKLATDDYFGQHTAPNKSSDDAPIYDVNINGIYPDDIYEGKGHQYIFEPGGEVGLNVILESHNKPNTKVTIYRAVPKIESRQEQINALEKEYKYIMKQGRISGTIEMNENNKKKIEKQLTEDYGKSDENSLYLIYIENKIKELENSSKKDTPKIKIEKGNWVSPSKQYAIQHGKSNLNNKYRLISKTVKAKDLYTDGNSLSEWGYDF